MLAARRNQEDGEAGKATMSRKVRTMNVVDVRELEWQFDAVDLRPVMRWLTEPADEKAGAVRIVRRGSATQVDVYVDTDDRRFDRAGYALRIRRTGRTMAEAAEATLKEIDSATTGEHGLRSRREVSELLEQADPELLRQSNGPVGERVRAVAGKKKLRPLFEVHRAGGCSRSKRTGFRQARLRSTKPRSRREPAVP